MGVLKFSRESLGFPYAVFLILFVALPLIVLLYYAFTNGQGKFTIANFTGFFTDPNTLGTLCYSFAVAFVTTGLCLLLAYPTAYITRLTKTSMLDALGQDYIRTARSKGVPTVKVIFKHALRNALIPVITYVGPMLAYILTGSLVVENIFTIGGLGQQFVKSINNRDYPMIMATTIFLAVIMVGMNLLSDIMYKIVDPRIKLY